jgi:Immunity protein 39
MSEPTKPPHGRKLGLIGTALTKARNPKGDVQALSAVRDELEAVLIASGYCEGAPFSWVTISIRFGLKEEIEPHYQAINKKYGDLPLAIEISTESMRGASSGELRRIFRDAALRALIHAGARHGRPVDALKAMVLV